jgi:Sulfotransferase domain
MNATLHKIESRSIPHPAESAILANFRLDKGDLASPDLVLNEEGWSLHCLDQASKMAVFVKTPPECDLSATAFMRMAQYQGAEYIMLVPWQSLPTLAKKLSEPENLIFIFNIGRSGTTLVSRMLAHVPDVLSLSEPEALFNVTREYHSNDPQLNRELILACTKLSCHPPYGSPHKTVAMKFQSQNILHCEDYFAVFPNAKYVFLYRDAKSWGNSIYKMCRSFGSPELWDQPHRDMVWNIFSASSSIEYLSPYLDMRAEITHPEQVIAPVWGFYLEHYLSCLARGIPFLAMRYNEINANHEAATKLLLKHCGLPEIAAGDAIHGFDQDSQKDSGIGQDNIFSGFKPEEYMRFMETLAKHPQFDSADIILPDIYSNKTGAPEL